MKLIEFGGIPGAGKSFMVNKLGLKLKEDLGYYPAPIFEWDQLLKNIPVWEDLEIQGNELYKFYVKVFKRFNIDLLGIFKPIIHSAEEGCLLVYKDLFLDIEDFLHKSEHAVKFPNDAKLISGYLKILTQYYYYIQQQTNWDCLLLSEGYGKHSTHIIAHQRLNQNSEIRFLKNAPRIDLYFYLEVDIKTAFDRKKGMKGFYSEYKFEEAEKLLKKTISLNESQIQNLIEAGIQVFKVKNDDFETALNFIYDKIKITLSD